jgi:lipid II:glycine glycyltransferase (peptidoglycan interpeptide bridge formation enzyme)
VVSFAANNAFLGEGMTKATMESDLQDSSFSAGDLNLCISRQILDSDWDSFLLTVPGANYSQSSLWAQGKSLLGYRVVRVTVVRNQRILGGAQILIRPSPFFGNFGFVPVGPVVTPCDFDVTELILDQLPAIASREKLHYLAVQPPGGSEQLIPELCARGFQSTPLDLAPSATLSIALTCDLDSLLKGMRKKARQKIRTSERSGVVVREGDESDLGTCYRLMTITGQRHEFKPYSQAHITGLWKLLAPAGAMKMFVSEFNGEPVSVLLVLAFAYTVTAWKTGWSGLHSNCCPNQALYWTAIQWAATRGYSTFDFGGISREIAAKLSCDDCASLPPKFRGYVFKLEFGGKVVLSPGSYAYLSNPALRFAHRALPGEIVGSGPLATTFKWLLSRLR